ncbi:MAG: AAA family ATPase [Bacteroidota bacterium]|nr:AAA family ATPase [Bacteroidota bacterium]
MKLENFKAANIHGFLNYDIHFNNSLSVIKGENGSGKTTLLKTINSFLSPSYKTLNNILFDRIEINGLLSSGKTFQIIYEKQDDNNCNIFLIHQNQNPIIGKLTKQNENDIKWDESKNLFETQEVIRKIKQLNTPFYIDTNRSLFCGENSLINKNQYILNRLYKNFPKEHSMYNALRNAQDSLYILVQHIEKNCLMLEAKKPIINQEFKNNLILNSFDFFKDQELEFIEDHEALKHKREQALEAFENLNLQGFIDHVNNFFNQLEGIQNKVLENERSKKKKSLDSENLILYQQWLYNQPQLKRFNQMIQFNLAFKNEKKKFYEPIDEIIKYTNNFLEKLNRKLAISSNGEILIEHLNNKKGSIFELSDGECHIIAIIIQLVFLKEIVKPDSGILLIDEPEIGIHPNWQNLLNEILITLKGDTQIILTSNSDSFTNNLSKKQIIEL